MALAASAQPHNRQRDLQYVSSVTIGVDATREADSGHVTAWSDTQIKVTVPHAACRTARSSNRRSTCRGSSRLRSAASWSSPRQRQAVDRHRHGDDWRQNAYSRHRQPDHPGGDRRSRPGRPDHRRPDLHDHRHDPDDGSVQHHCASCSDATSNRFAAAHVEML